MTERSLADDTLEGAAAIAAFVGKSLRQTQWLLEAKQLPAFKIGAARKWHMRKSTYLSFIEHLEAEAGKQTPATPMTRGG